MATCESARALPTLELPAELAEVAGIVHADLRAVVSALADQAHRRLRLTRREYRDLQLDLWGRLVDVINEVAQPLSAEAR